MAGNYRKPTDNKQPIPFTIQAGEETCSGTITPSGKLPAFGMPNAFIVRMPGKPSVNRHPFIWVNGWMQAPGPFVKALGEMDARNTQRITCFPPEVFFDKSYITDFMENIFLLVGMYAPVILEGNLFPVPADFAILIPILGPDTADG